jgi:hypothetical protein
MLSALANHPARTTRVRIAPLVAAIALLAGLAATAGDADAAVLTDGTIAEMHVNCTTAFDFGQRIERRQVGISVLAGTAGVWMQSQTYVNGKFAGSSGWKPLSQGWTTTTPNSYVVRMGTAAEVLSIRVQFAKVIGGRWHYSPNGMFEYAYHTTRGVSYLGTTFNNTGSYCLLGPGA